MLAKALAVAPRVLIVIGSAGAPPSVKNPFSVAQRIAMIRACLAPADRERVGFVAIRDYFDNGRWSEAVQDGVAQAAATLWPDRATGRIGLVGHDKDASTGYLRLFPGWQLVLIPRQGPVDATDVRRLCWELSDPGERIEQLTSRLPAPVLQRLQAWMGLGGDTIPLFSGQQADYQRLCAEHHAILESRRKWGIGPFVTLDAVVIACGHVLLIQRGRAPGQGLWALPGGFLDIHERLYDGALRELLEETGLDLRDPLFNAKFLGAKVFDHPDRSLRARTITHAHGFELSVTHLPKVAGDDDAASASWVPLAEVSSLEGHCFDDHFYVLDQFLGVARPGPLGIWRADQA